MKIRIKSKDNFYNDREAEVLRTTIVCDVEVNWVRIMTSGGGSIETAIRKENCEEVE